jgi:hypothetical protein
LSVPISNLLMLFESVQRGATKLVQSLEKLDYKKRLEATVCFTYSLVNWTQCLLLKTGSIFTVKFLVAGQLTLSISWNSLYKCIKSPLSRRGTSKMKYSLNLYLKTSFVTSTKSYLSIISNYKIRESNILELTTWISAIFHISVILALKLSKTNINRLYMVDTI